MLKIMPKRLSISVFITLILVNGQLFALPDQANTSQIFDMGFPEQVKEIPAGQLRRRLESLPPEAREKALKWLQEFSFPMQDLGFLRIDNDGGVFYEDTFLPEEIESTDNSQSPLAEAIPAAETLFLHSRPGSENIIYLDFDGHTITGTAWNDNVGTDPLIALPFDPSNDGAAFSDDELTRISEIWHRVAEDFAPYGIDVTTEEPDSFNSRTGRILFTHDSDATGANMPSVNAGGVAYVNVFGSSSYHTRYSPALVYYTNLGSGFAPYNAEAASHEFGHNIGLSHDGTSSGTTYYSGHGSDNVSWAPIMGLGYYNNVTQWSKGEYLDANQTQDDLALIAADLGYRADDHGNTTDTASKLYVEVNGDILASNPESDPHDVYPQNKGVIETGVDIDFFYVDVSAGLLNITITPAWDAFYRTSRKGANLDVEAKLYDINGVQIPTDIPENTDPINDTDANVSATVAAGRYYVSVDGVGNDTNSDYSDYGSLGQYYISGTVQAPIIDTNPPNPDPMTWATVPTVTGSDSITMTATTAIDDSGIVEYNFRCVAGGTGCVDSGWQADTVYNANGLSPETSYSFEVAARDSAANQTAPSVIASAMTDAPPPPPPIVDQSATGESFIAGTVSGNHTSTHNDDGISESITERESGGNKSRRYSYLEHIWSFNVSPGNVITVFANTWSGGSIEGDNFVFAYSEDGNNYTDMFTVSSIDSTNMQSFRLPGSSNGTIYIRVRDTNRDSGRRNKDTVYVDHLVIRSENAVGDPPASPSALVATAISSAQVDLVWVDNATDESGFEVERSDDGGNSWSLVAAQAVSNLTAYSDTGLNGLQTYHYRVAAYNASGTSVFSSSDSATTLAGAEITLSVSGYKVKGIQHSDLSWSGVNAADVDIYRDGNVIVTASNSNTYTDNIGKNGGGSYVYMVCEKDSTTDCSDEVSINF